MVRITAVCLTLGVMLVGLGRAGIPTGTFTISTPDRKVYLADRNGRLTTGPPDRGVEADGFPAQGRWYVLGTQIKSSVGGGYLAYDPAGKSNAVFLTPRPGGGTQWTVSPGGPYGPGDRAAIRVGSGPKKGWYLGVEAVQENKGGRTVTVHRLVLSEGRALELEAEQIYLHK
jgi:hypothetical protein